MPKSSSDKPGAELLDAREHLRGVLGIFHHQRFGEFELERAARQRRAREHGAQVLDQVVAQQLPRRDVDAGEDRLAIAVGGAARCASWRAVRSSTNRPRSTIRPISSAIEMNSAGDRRPSLGMIPARQRLEAGDRAVLQPHDRLVQHLDLLALDGAAQFRFHGQPVGLARAHRRLEHLDAVAADALGVIHRQLGVLEHLLGAVRLAFGEREADRGGEEDFAVVEGDRRAQRPAHASRRRRRCAPAPSPTAG